jgi:hypothetical protein
LYRLERRQLTHLDDKDIEQKWLTTSILILSYLNFRTFAVVYIFAVFFFLGDYPASCLKFKPTFRDHYLSRHQGCNWTYLLYHRSGGLFGDLSSRSPGLNLKGTLWGLVVEKRDTGTYLPLVLLLYSLSIIPPVFMNPSK